MPVPRAVRRIRPFAPPSPEAVAQAPVQVVCEMVRSIPEGLSAAEASRRLAAFGPNEVPLRPARSLAATFFEQFTHLLAILLWVAALLAFVGRMPELGWAIIAVIVVNGVFSFAQEYRAARLLQALRRRSAGRARVRRDGAVVEVDARELTPGDVVLLREGDRVPADARVIEATGLEVDESSLTGESVAVSKTAEPVADAASLTELRNVVFAGTLVVHGDAEAIIFATGADTQFGAISGLTAGIETGAGPLEREIESLARTTATVAVVSGLVIWGVSTGLLRRDVGEGFVFAVGIIVALVPEGLLPTLSLSLAIGVQRMAGRNVLVRRLASIEALGATQVICTDKTGTLTRNEMTVQRVWLPSGEFAVTGTGYEPEGTLVPLDGSGDRDAAAEAVRAAALASNATLSRDEGGAWVGSGDPTEVAIVVAARKLGPLPRAERLAEAPFDAFRRMMSTLDRVNGAVVLHVKGAPDSVLPRCVSGPDGAPLSERDREAALRQADRYAEDGMRVLAVARRDGVPPHADPQALEERLRFLGLLAMIDPVRPEAVEAIRKCREAGIRVVIITGDHPATAAYVAREAGVVRARPHVVTGRDLEAMTPEALRATLLRDVVFARTTPTDKLMIVSALQEAGFTVAVIGDGVNDAPSLRRADVGVAMGRTGTDVAREAADIVLMDDNFATIVDAIEEGRAIFANIRKFVTYVFTSNVAELVPFAAMVLTGIPLPLKVLQVIAVDLGTDLLPALGLGAERPEPGTMREPPRPRSARILSRAVLLRTFLLLGPVEAALGLAGYFFVYWAHGWRFGEPLADAGHVYALATTMTFAAIVVGQIGNVFACRSPRESLLRISVTGNPLLLAGVAVEVAALLALLYLPPLQDVFEFAGPGWREWLFLAAILPLLPLADELRKAAARAFARSPSRGTGPDTGTSQASQWRRPRRAPAG
ncbi:MAG TPA: cation-transporting P-type ATPase [Dehalococcoidia bacterium]|nr:cation-transporting P-type ATPase [Dehalococcoidia bacterium]